MLCKTLKICQKSKNLACHMKLSWLEIVCESRNIENTFYNYNTILHTIMQ